MFKEVKNTIISLNKCEIIQNVIEYIGLENADYELFYKAEKDYWYRLDLTMNTYDKFTTKELVKNLLDDWLNDSMIAELKESTDSKNELSNMLKDFYKHVTLLELMLNEL